MLNNFELNFIFLNFYSENIIFIIYYSFIIVNIYNFLNLKQNKLCKKNQKKENFRVLKITNLAKKC